MKLPQPFFIVVGLVFPAILLGQPIDTLEVRFENTELNEKVYMAHLFRHPGKWFTWKHPEAGLTAQDSLIVLGDDGGMDLYVKFYDKKGRLFFEGEKHKPDSRLVGDVRFYYPNGNLRVIKHFGNQTFKVSEEIVWQANEILGPEGIWKYYDRKGSLRKIEDYNLVIDKPSNTFTFRLTTKRFNRNGRVASTSHKPLHIGSTVKKENN